MCALILVQNLWFTGKGTAVFYAGIELKYV